MHMPRGREDEDDACRWAQRAGQYDDRCTHGRGQDCQPKAGERVDDGGGWRGWLLQWRWWHGRGHGCVYVYRYGHVHRGCVVLLAHMVGLGLGLGMQLPWRINDDLDLVILLRLVHHTQSFLAWAGCSWGLFKATFALSMACKVPEHVIAHAELRVVVCTSPTLVHCTKCDIMVLEYAPSLSFFSVVFSPSLLALRPSRSHFTSA